MSEKYPKYQFINYDTHYITFRKYLDKLNYIDIDFPYEELEYTLNKGIVLQDRINKAVEYIEEEVFGIKYGNFVKPCGYENTNCDNECEKLVQILKGDKE